MPDAPVFTVIDRNLGQLRENLQRLCELYAAEATASTMTKTLSEFRDRITREERMLRTRLGLEPLPSSADDISLSSYFKTAIDTQKITAMIYERLRNAQELARTLEEYFLFFKLGSIAGFYKRVRYELYEYERDTASLLGPLRPLPAPKLEEKPSKSSPSRIESALKSCPLYFILDQSLCQTRDPLRLGYDAVAGGTRMIQLRQKQGSTRQLIDLARKLRGICSERESLLIINDRLDIAMLVGADGIHIGQEDLTVAEVRQLSPSLLVGVTARNPQAALAAQAEGANYVGAGSVYPSTTKPGLPVIGLRGLRSIVAAVDIPVVGIGGITLANCQKVMQTGVAGLCSVTPFASRRSTKNLVADFKRACQQS